jgi:hypothetical protein
MTVNTRKLIPLAVIAAFFIISMLPLCAYFTSTSFTSEFNKTLETKNSQALALFGSAMAASTAVSLLPGDIGASISYKLADAAGFFMIVFGAITIEKIVLSASGFLTFRIIIPAALLLFSVYIIFEKRFFFILALKSIIFGVMIVLIIPVSIKISNIVESRYLYTDAGMQIDDAVNNLNMDTEEIEQVNGISGGSEEARSWWDIPGRISDAAKNITAKVEQITQGAVEKANNALAVLMTALVNMIITVCVIPLITIAGFTAITKALWNISPPTVKTGPQIKRINANARCQ